MGLLQLKNMQLAASDYTNGYSFPRRASHSELMDRIRTILPIPFPQHLDNLPGRLNPLDGDDPNNVNLPDVVLYHCSLARGKSTFRSRILILATLKPIPIKKLQAWGLGFQTLLRAQHQTFETWSSTIKQDAEEDEAGSSSKPSRAGKSKSKKRKQHSPFPTCSPSPTSTPLSLSPGPSSRTRSSKKRRTEAEPSGPVNDVNKEPLFDPDEPRIPVEFGIPYLISWYLSGNTTPQDREAIIQMYKEMEEEGTAVPSLVSSSGSSSNAAASTSTTSPPIPAIPTHSPTVAKYAALYQSDGGGHQQGVGSASG
ncbi:hypothetical protein BKA70DRAFT_1440609 [Coprinopsis sp. MPI-PUGE-AT-0042]|nr:hypothetical protein BKA70DRAFT_1440609 [Coprinopsis sp. MPI-PUGE-AT-0042]